MEEWQIKKKKDAGEQGCALFRPRDASVFQHSFYLPFIIAYFLFFIPCLLFTSHHPVITLSLLYLLISTKSHIIEKEANALVLKSSPPSPWVYGRVPTVLWEPVFSAERELPQQMVWSPHHFRAPICFVPKMLNISLDFHNNCKVLQGEGKFSFTYVELRYICRSFKWSVG